MKNPGTLDKATAEIDAAFNDGRLTSPVQYNQASKLPYLMALIKESFRLFSPFAAPLQRYSPPQGIVLAGTHIPGGWRVGLNPAVVMHNKEVFGEDAGLFRPERWLEADPEQRKLMDKCMMHFGAGSRSCTGKHVGVFNLQDLSCANKKQVALTETYKIVPMILHRYDVKMAHDKPWTTQNAAFCFQTGVECNLRRRLPS